MDKDFWKQAWSEAASNFFVSYKVAFHESGAIERGERV